MLHRSMRSLLATAMVPLLAACGAVSSGDDGTDPGGDTGKPTGPLTIYDIRNPAAAQHPAIGTSVTLKGKIVTGVSAPDANGRINFFIQEPEGGEWSGIYVYDTAKQGPDVKVGDEVTVKGSYSEFKYSTDPANYLPVSELGLSTWEITANNLEVAPLVIPAAEISTIATGGARAESLESVLVKIDGAIDVVELTDLAHGEVRVGTSITSGIRVDDLLFADSETGKGIGQPVTTMIGVLWYTFGDYKLEPRSASDFVAGEIPTKDVTVYQVRDHSTPDAVVPGALVRLSDMVVTAVAGDGTGAFFAQLPEASYRVTGDPSYGAIYVHRSSKPTNTAVAVGDVVTFEGGYSEYPAGGELAASLAEVSATSVTVTNAGGGVVPAPYVVADASLLATGGLSAEALESALVRVEGVAVTTANPDPDAVPDPGDFVVDGSLRVGKYLFAGATDAGRAALGGDPIAYVQGPLYFTGGETRIVPRSAADLNTSAAPYPLEDIRRVQLHQVVEGVGVGLTNVEVTAIVDGTGNGDFFVQMRGQTDTSNSGLYVTRLAGVTTTVAVGDVVALEGKYSETTAAHPGLTVLTAKSVTVTSQTPAAERIQPTKVPPASIATGGWYAGRYESVLVAVQEVAITVGNPDAPADHGEVAVTGGLRVGSLVFTSAARFARVAVNGFNSIVGPLYFAGGNQKVLPRGPSDIDRKPITPADVTVYQIQDPTAPGAVALDTIVRVADVVVTAVTGSGDGAFFVQIPEAASNRGVGYSGIFCSRNAGATPVVAVGDVVTVTGQYVELTDAEPLMSAILVDRVSVTSSAGTLPTPVAVTTQDLGNETSAEPYEGVLVQLGATSVLRLYPDETDQGEFEVASAGDTVGVRVGNMVDASVSVVGRRAVAGFSSIQGVVTQAAGGFRVQPRASGLAATALPVLSVYDIKQGTAAVGSAGKVQNLVVTASVGAGNSGFFVQVADGSRDGTLGAQYSAMPAAMLPVALVTAVGDPAVTVAAGDAVELEGVVTSSGGIVSFGVTKVTKNGAGTATVTVVPAATLGATPAPYDSLLVEIDDATVATPYPDADDVGAFTITAGTGELRVAKGLFDASIAGRRAVAGLTKVVGVLAPVASGHELWPRSAADVVAKAIPAATVYDLQDRSLGTAVAVGGGARLTGVIVTGFMSGGTTGFWVQLPDASRDTHAARFSGIYCQRTPVSLSDFAKVARNDVLTLEGTYSESAGSTFVVTKVEKTGTNSTGSTATAATAAEAMSGDYEGVVVTLSSVAVVDVNPDTPSRGEIVVTGGLRVGSLITAGPAKYLAQASAIATLTGPVVYSAGNYVLEPRTWTDVSATFPTIEATVYDIQDPASSFPAAVQTSSSAVALNVATVVKLTGLVVTGVITSGSSGSAPYGKIFFAQVPTTAPYYKGPEYSGIYVYGGTLSDNTGGGAAAVAEGDIVDVTGPLLEYYNLTEISKCSVTSVCSGVPAVVTTIQSHGAAVPAPVVVAPGNIATGGPDGEKYESVLVRVENVSIGSPANPDSGEFNEFQVTGGLRANDLIWYLWKDDAGSSLLTTLRAQPTFTFIQGPLDYANSNFKIEPRRASDIQYP